MDNAGEQWISERMIKVTDILDAAVTAVVREVKLTNAIAPQHYSQLTPRAAVQVNAMLDVESHMRRAYAAAWSSLKPIAE